MGTTLQRHSHVDIGPIDCRIEATEGEEEKGVLEGTYLFSPKKHQSDPVPHISTTIAEIEGRWKGFGGRHSVESIE